MFGNRDGTFWLPPQASTGAHDVDQVFYLIYWVDVFFFVVLMTAMIYFFFKYRQRREGERTSPVKGNHALEIAWAVIPGLLLILFFVVGVKAYVRQAVPPEDAMEVRVTGRTWSWQFDYPDQGVTSDILRVPAGVPIKLLMSSVDVIHSFSVPDFRVKKDVLPNRYTVAWFEAPDPGEHHVFCTEYCGDGHSRMLSTVEVMPPEEFEAWLAAETEAGAAATTGAGRGERLVKGKGCLACHSADGSPALGPTLKGLYGKQEALTDGTTVTVDDNYLRESLMAPAARIVAGFGPQMPPYQGQLSDAEVNDIIDYIKSLKD